MQQQIRTTLRALIVLFLVSLAIERSSAQFSLFAGIESPDAPFWDPVVAEDLRFLQAGYGLGAGYFWEIGEEPAVALGPVIRYQAFSGGPLQQVKAEIRLTGLEFKVRLYPTRLLLSCDCPELKRRVFIELSTAWHYARMELSSPDFHEWVQDKSMSIGGGVGLHFPLGDQISLDPVLRICQIPELTWEGLERFSDNPQDPLFRTTSGLNLFQVELHFSLRSFK